MLELCRWLLKPRTYILRTFVRQSASATEISVVAAIETNHKTALKFQLILCLVEIVVGQNVVRKYACAKFRSSRLQYTYYVSTAWQKYGSENGNFSFISVSTDKLLSAHHTCNMVSRIPKIFEIIYPIRTHRVLHRTLNIQKILASKN